MTIAQELGICTQRPREIIYYSHSHKLQVNPTERRLLRIMSRTYREVEYEPHCGHCGSPFVELTPDEKTGYCQACEGELLNV